MKKNITICLLLSISLFLLFLLFLFTQRKQIHVSHLKTEMLENPKGIDCLQPRLSWRITSGKKDVQQKSYHIIVSSSADKLKQNQGDLWDSGEVNSPGSIHIDYKGKGLESRMPCYWKVKVTTNKGTSEWSRPASWEMGLLNSSDWSSRWIGLDKHFPGDVLEGETRLSARYLRKEINLSAKKIKKATLYISGLGFYEAYINSKKIGNQVLAPTPTDYTKAVKYNTFDVTDHLIAGKNTIGVVLGNGRYFSMRMPGIRHFGFPKMIAQLEITNADGSTQIINSDATWKVTADGPILCNNEFDGEEYDAGKEMTGWNANGFNDNNWFQAELVEHPGGKLEAQLNRNMKIMDTITPVAIYETTPGVYILDMGQNMVGWLRMRVKGHSGDEIKLRFSELVKKDGTLYMDNLRSAKVTDKYRLKSNVVETREPTFTYHGFRYVELTGFREKPALKDFEGQVIYDEMETTGHFETSDSTINQIYKNAYWGIKGNYRGMPTDCPQRDERMGWLGDRAVGSHGESFIFNHSTLYAKWLDDIEQAQLDNGAVPDVAPNYWSVYTDNMTWPGAYLIIANMLYEQFGDKQPIIKHYDSMKKWMNYMKSNYMTDYIMTKDHHGDWCMPPESPELIHSKDPSRITEAAVLGTTFYYHLSNLMVRFAKITNNMADAEAFEKEADAVKKAFNDTYLHKEQGYYSNNTVTSNILPLQFGMVPEEYTEAVFNNIVKKTEVDFGGHVSTGLVGIQQLMRGLSEHGRIDLAYKITTNRTYPSWGYMVDNGATTIWELWNGNTADPAMNSANHVMLLGDLIVWYYEYLAGIRNREGSVGFKEIVLKPHPVKGLNYVNASFNSVYGQIKSNWSKSNNTFQWNIEIPCNVSAMVYVPQSASKTNKKSKNNIRKEGGKYIKTENGYEVFAFPSGTYNLITEYPED